MRGWRWERVAVVKCDVCGEDCTNGNTSHAWGNGVRLDFCFSPACGDAADLMVKLEDDAQPREHDYRVEA